MTSSNESAKLALSLQKALDSHGFGLLGQLGSGGVGQVFLARSQAGKFVAIKVVACRPGDSSASALAREASVCARLHHAAIVQVRGFVETPGFSAVVFEYVPGVALARLLRYSSRSGRRLPDRSAWHVVERVLAGLAYAHLQHDEWGRPLPIVHRDVSPSNVLLDWDGEVKLADFGIAIRGSALRETRTVKGTFGCMAPEQARGDTVTERADVYAGALLAWRLATGRGPFAAYQHDDFELVRAMRNPQIRSLSQLRPDLPPALCAAVCAALVSDPRERTITAAEFARVVRAEVDTQGGKVELAGLLKRARPGLEEMVSSGVASEGCPPEMTSDDVNGVTMRYEQVALAFEDERADNSDFESPALPSDRAMPATLPHESGPPSAPSREGEPE